MGKGVLMAILGVFALLSSTLVVADSAVTMERVVILGEFDLGIEGATISPDGNSILAHGAESAVFVIDSYVPENNSKVD